MTEVASTLIRATYDRLRHDVLSGRWAPGRKLRMVGNLPAGVVLQWRKWCLHPRYSVGAEGELARRAYANARFPVVALSIADDELMTLQGTHSLVSLYENAPRRWKFSQFDA